MQRVLSLQAARSFGESTEFVTKRMCFSFLFSIGFLCLLCGFLIGRFAAQRAVDIRAEREQKAVAGNGLESGEQLQQRIIQELETRGFDGPTDLTRSMRNTALRNVETMFSALDFFSKLGVTGGCLTAKVNGSLETDRYVVVTTGGEENIDIVIEVVEELHKSTSDNDWKPRRTLMFLLYENSLNDCLQLFSDYEKSKIVALLAIDKTAIDGNGYFVSSGSDIVQTTVLKSFENYAGPKTYENTYLPRLKLNIPHSVITFMGSTNDTKSEGSPEHQQQITFHRRNLAKILASSLWNLSHMNIFQWNPRIVEDTMKRVFSNLTTPDLRPYIQQIKGKLTSITEYGRILNDEIGQINGVKSLVVRMTNDLLKDVERALLCPDDNFQSQTDITLIAKSQKNQEIIQILGKMLSCFDTVIQILQDMT
ncbi:uncharacterized protein LOC107038500 [Diachasma alloeum]|uniref:uncharacterized protein LOC107038500 n=1 Tax=Diachasma alloeum TaxID=454923 RepID=UPI0007384337|nr:uncharacterized protein LOC107038500 [Diachasma alloeum]